MLGSTNSLVYRDPPFFFWVPPSPLPLFRVHSASRVSAEGEGVSYLPWLCFRGMLFSSYVFCGKESCGRVSQSEGGGRGKREERGGGEWKKKEDQSSTQPKEKWATLED